VIQAKVARAEAKLGAVRRYLIDVTTRRRVSAAGAR